MTEAALLTVDEAVAEIFTEFSTSNRKRLYALIHTPSRHCRTAGRR